jgi:hypothetical protein
LTSIGTDKFGIDAYRRVSVSTSSVSTSIVIDKYRYRQVHIGIDEYRYRQSELTSQKYLFRHCSVRKKSVLPTMTSKVGPRTCVNIFWLDRKKIVPRQSCKKVPLCIRGLLTEEIDKRATVANRVTRLLTLVSFLIAKLFFGYLPFHEKSCVLILTKMGWATYWAIFHKNIWSPWLQPTRIKLS